MTALADPPPLAVDVPATPGLSFAGPVATIGADLLPDEIRLKRRLGYLKRRLAFVLAALVALVVLGDLLVHQQTSSAEGDLSAANSHITTLNTQVQGFNRVLSVQSETQAIWAQLGGVMGSDVSWPGLLNQLAGPAPAGLRLTSITAQVSGATGSTATSTASGAAPITPGSVGSITLSGTAPNWAAVATYVHGLATTKYFTAVNPSSVSNGAGGLSGGGSSLTFTITLDLTSAVINNRYTDATVGSAPAGSTGSTPGAGSTTSARSVTKTLGSAGAGNSTAQRTSRTTKQRHQSTSQSGALGNPQEAN